MSLVDPNVIIEAVSRHYGVRPSVLRGDDRHKSVALARAVGMYLTRKLTDLSYPAIGGFYGGKHHTTVMVAVQKVEGLVDAGAPGSLLSVIEDVAEIRAQVADASVVAKLDRLAAKRAGLVRQMAEIDQMISELSEVTAGAGLRAEAA